MSESERAVDAASSAGFSAFYAATAPRMVQHLFLLTGDLSRAQECVQDAYAQAWRRWPHLQDGDPAAWVRRVGWRLAVSDWRRRAAFWRALARHGVPADAPRPLGGGGSRS
ncbi:sigma factor [Motilibacter aurantiacus]|uniref:sigma factor n=1 Tax=Motilibacter aurantiacus TaxID=2714955 RepID=UPI002F2B3CB7